MIPDWNIDKEVNLLTILEPFDASSLELEPGAESAALLAGILASAMDAIISVDADQKIILFNAAAEKIFRCAKADALGTPLERFIPERFRAQHREHIRAFGATGVTRRSMGHRLSLSGLRADGQEFPIEASISKLRQGDTQYFTVIVRDMTEPQRAAQAKQELEKFLAQTFISNPAAMLITRVEDGVLVDMNDTFETQWGYPRAESIGRSIYDLNLYLDPAHRFAYLQQLVREGTVQNFELQVKTRGGEIRDVLLFGTLIRLEHQTHTLTHMVDITERKRAEDALRASEERFQHVLDTMMEGCQIIDFDWRYVYANDAVLEQSQHRRDELIGHTMMETFPGIEQTEMFAALQECMRERVSRRIETRFVFPDGRVGWFELGVQPAPQGIFILSSDITARKLAQARTEQINAELEVRVAERTAQLKAANQELEAFTYSVSHDLRAPLRAIDGFSRNVLKKYGDALPDEGKRYLDIVRANTQQMGTLIDDLLALSRLGRQAFSKTRVPVEPLVREITHELQSEEGERNIHVTYTNLENCLGDAALLKQLWRNLISNAFKYSRHRDPARIEIAQTQLANQDVFSIRDNGTGFDMRYADKLFGVFQRLHRAEEYEGTGVGLAIVQRIVLRHGGRVWAEAEPDKGATFFFSLPRESGKVAP